MKASKSLYSTCFEEYKLSDDLLKKLQHELLLMFLDIKSICDKYDIDYMLSGGTLLGAVRHNGFIPWDDDIDIMMTRHEYDRFRKVFNNTFTDKYVLAEPLSDPKYFCKMPKIYKKGTTYVEIPNAGINAYDMIFIDIFIIENIPNSKIIQWVKSKIYNFAYKGSSVCIDYLYPSPIIMEKSLQNQEVNEYYKFRRKIGCLFSHVGGINFYLRICEKFAQTNRRTRFMGVPSAISYEREILPSDIFVELTVGNFCGSDVKIPANYDRYLTNLYGNYMELPPLEKREYHVAYKCKF